MRETIESISDLKDMKRMIEKECQRNSLKDLCESWDFECGAFYGFLDMAEKYFNI